MATTKPLRAGEMLRLDRHGFRWELAANAEEFLEVLLSQNGQTIKESPPKRVSRHEAGGRVFYVKRYRHDAVPLRSFKFFLKTSPARREWMLAYQCEALGVPVVRHVAHGERRDWRGLRESILITEGFDGRPLDEVTGITPAAVMEFVSNMHERGVRHDDLHAGNVLARLEPLEFRLLDLDKARVQPSVSTAEREENLAFMGISFPLPLTGRAAERRFALRRELFRARSRRCLRHNREFAPQRHGALTWRVRLPLVTPAVERVLADPDGFFQRAKLMKRGATATVGIADGLVLKRFNFRKVLNLVKDLFRRSRAYRAARKAYHLELVGVPTARVVAVAERRVIGVLTRSYQLMEEIPGAKMLQTFLRQGGQPGRELIDEAAQVIARLHDEGFTHGDLNERNLVLDERGRVYLIDLDALDFLGTVPPARAAEDLQRLARGVAGHAAVTRAHRELFLRHYCRARGLRKVPRAA